MTDLTNCSFRDPSGYVFCDNGVYYRKICKIYYPQYIHLIQSGLYASLVHKKMLIPHKESEINKDFFIIIPQQIPLISYPYEWSFSMLKDAALMTLKIHKTALSFGMCLKDASAYNIQFLSGRPIFIDTLSFDFYQENMPWGAYSQFCRHFLAPLLLMSNVDIHLNTLLKNYIDGIPLDVADNILRMKGGLTGLLHIHFHRLSIDKHGTDNIHKEKVSVPVLSLKRQINLIDHLISAVEKIYLPKQNTEWGNYYEGTNYTEESMKKKVESVRCLLGNIEGKQVWDFGANDGKFTRIAMESGAKMAAAFDIDPIAVDNNYKNVKSSGAAVLPLVYDINNPTPAIGFANSERFDLLHRGSPDIVLMLALIHHLCITNNLSFDQIAVWVNTFAPVLIIEFVPKEDSQVQRLLTCRRDIFVAYTQLEFEKVFSNFYEIKNKFLIPHTHRYLYKMVRLSCTALS